MLSINSIRTLALAAALFCLPAAGVTPAFAQAPAVTPATPLDKLTPAQIAAGRELVMLSGMHTTFNAFVPSILQQIFNTVTPTRPEIRKDLEDTLKALQPEYEKRTEEMIAHTGKLFASVMSEADLAATVAFFKTAAGKKYVEMQPRVIDDMVVSIDDWNRKLTGEIMDRTRIEMKKKGKDM